MAKPRSKPAQDDPFEDDDISATASTPRTTRRSSYTRGSNSDVDEAIGEADKLVATIDDAFDAGLVPAAGEDFFQSVRKTAASIAATMEEKGFVTDNQREAIGNMASGVERWLANADDRDDFYD